MILQHFQLNYSIISKVGVIWGINKLLVPNNSSGGTNNVVSEVTPENIIKGKFLLLNANIFEDPEANKGKYIDGEKKKNTRVDFVDLSGSERLAKRDVVDELTKKESLFINKSLSSLNNVLNAIRIKSKHIPYRDSKLTFYLKESITKSVNILLILQCSPKSEDESETICTLDFGSRFCNVVGYDSGRERLLTTKHNRSYSTNNTNGNL